ncbi:MAG: response regulator, partial [Chitinophagaceae bacterium]|nr:response regulator [Rubrivivax sp.]
KRLAEECRGARILLADDDPVNQEITSELLGRLGLVVDIASNGLEAVQQVQSAPYDLVLMDMMMPVCDGLEATRAIRALPDLHDLPIVAMTANAFVEDRDACRAAGMNDQVAKPVEIEAFYATVLRCLQVARDRPVTAR